MLLHNTVFWHYFNELAYYIFINLSILDTVAAPQTGKLLKVGSTEIWTLITGALTMTPLYLNINITWHNMKL